MLDKIDKGTAISVGLMFAIITIVFAAGVLYSQVQRNSIDIASINSRLDSIENSNQNVLEQITIVKTKLDLLLDK